MTVISNFLLIRKNYNHQIVEMSNSTKSLSFKIRLTLTLSELLSEIYKNKIHIFQIPKEKVLAFWNENPALKEEI